ncbi:MAG TPA: pullulanase-type alpha-1,6-glucosidase [Roseiflexaceae bacterium]|nr:pullulanase-type alpha-1,6-glucosidase [Roseiflexaceae bacterium]
MTINERPAVALADKTAAESARGDLRLARAHWISRDTIAWNLPDAPAHRFRLHYDAGAGLRLTGTGIVGGHTLPLRYDPQGLSPAARARFPHLAGYAAFRLDLAGDADLAELLTCQLAISATTPDGAPQDATGLQLPGVLDELFTYDGPLGATFEGGAPTLRLWAPTARSVTLHLFDSADAPAGAVVPMERGAWGVWSACGAAGWRGKFYVYEVEVYVRETGRIERTFVSDPYSVGLSANSTRSLIVDLRDPALAPAGWAEHTSPPLDAPEDIVIYELHVRDFSSADPSVPEDLRGTYRAFTLPNSHGMRHLRALAGDGLTHIHLLPCFDIATIEERRAHREEPDPAALAALPPDSDRQAALVETRSAHDGFNWGYDPYHYSVPEGSYATEPDGAARTVEFRAMVQALHAAGLRVVMDVVYNHTSAAGLHEHAVLDRAVPGYYHRLNADGFVEHSTCCNNTASEHAMMEKLLIDSALLWVTQYGVDGFRFDLMGHHMRDTMQRLRARLDALTPERDGVDGRRVYVYGEGWDFGEVANNARGVNATQINMAGSGIGSFNDRLRDAVRGGAPFGHPRDQGFATGLYDASSDHQQGSADDQRRRLLGAADLIRLGLAGNLRDYVLTDWTGVQRRGDQFDYGWRPAAYAQAPRETINYVEAHDNETLFDAIQLKASAATSIDERVRMHVLASSVVLLAQGIPFIHAGQDLLRSKSLDRNSYNSGDWFNRIDWTGGQSTWGAGLPPGENRDRWPMLRPLLADPALRPTPAHIRAAAEAFRTFLRIRSSSPLFRLRDADQIRRRVSFPGSGPGQTPGLIAMLLSDETACPLDPRHALIVVLFNAASAEQRVVLPALAGRALALHPEQASGPDQLVWQARFDPQQAIFSIPRRTTAVFVVERIPSKK